MNELANLNGTWDRFDSRNIYDVQFLMFNKYFAIPLIRNIYVRIVFLYLDFEPNDFNNYLYTTGQTISILGGVASMSMS